MNDLLGKIHCGDCIEGMNALPAKSVHLAFADPPFNIGYKYDVYEDRLAAEDYLKWSSEWMQAVARLLTNNGTFWLAIGDDFAAELKLAALDAGFHMRSWVIWYYTFGVNCKNKFTRSHTHLFYFVKDRELFTFRADDPENRVPSARQLVYNDRRANSKGRLPDDTWIIPPNVEQTFALRPQDLAEQFGPDEDTWYFPRVAGTFKERAGFHGCQMPEQLLGRIVRNCSNEHDVVIDPFSGSASTLTVARKLGRRVIGFELSEDYTKAGSERLNATKVGDELTGAAEPTMSAKRTPGKQTPDKTAVTIEPTESCAAAGSSSETVTAEAGPADTDGEIQAPVSAAADPPSVTESDVTAPQPAVTNSSAAGSKELLPLTRRLYDVLNETIAAAFVKIHEGWAVDRVLTDPALQAAFYEECVRLGLPLSQKETCLRLLKLRKKGGALKGSQRYAVSGAECEPYLHGCEMAWATMESEYPEVSLEEILSDPGLAAEFDAVAERFAPGFTRLDYRWGALRLRKSVHKARERGHTLRPPSKFWLGDRFADFQSQRVPDVAGIYLIFRDDECLYVGAAANLRERLQELTGKPTTRWGIRRKQLSFRHFATPEKESDLLAWVSAVVSQQDSIPQFNLDELYASRTA
jgi:site-specific DNA-methyltransferase (adenine-specific)